MLSDDDSSYVNLTITSILDTNSEFEIIEENKSTISLCSSNSDIYRYQNSDIYDIENIDENIDIRILKLDFIVVYIFSQIYNRIFNKNMQDIGIAIYEINHYFKKYDTSFYINSYIFIFKEYKEIIEYLENTYFKIKCELNKILEYIENDFLSCIGLESKNADINAKDFWQIEYSFIEDLCKIFGFTI